MNEGHLHVVGKLYNPNRTKWPEVGEYNYRAGSHELRIFYNNPTEEEIEAIRAGPCRFAFYPYLSVIFFCYKFGSLPWADASYSWHLVGEEDRTVPPDPDSAAERSLLLIFLIDASNGILRAMRGVSFSPAFTRALHAAIWKQMETPFPGKEEHTQQGLRLYAQYSSTDIAERLAIARCRGGD